MNGPTHINLLLEVNDNNEYEIQSYYAIVVLSAEQRAEIKANIGLRGLVPLDETEFPVGFLGQDYNRDATKGKLMQAADFGSVDDFFGVVEVTPGGLTVLGNEYEPFLIDEIFAAEYHNACWEIDNHMIQYGDEHFRFIAYSDQGDELRTAWIPFNIL